MSKRPVIPFSNGELSISCLLFKLAEDLSEWQNKSGIYIYAKLRKKNDKPYLKIIYIGCTLNFSNVKYTAGNSIMRHEPTHICFYPSNDKDGIRDISKALIDFYKPVVKGADIVKIRKADGGF